MKKLLLSLLLVPLFSLASSPREYKIAIKYYQGGKLVASPMVVVNENREGEISETDGDTQNGRFVRVTPTRWKGPNSDNQVHLHFSLGKIENGKKVELARPEIVALEGETASMEITDYSKDGTPDLTSFKVEALVVRQN